MNPRALLETLVLGGTALLTGAGVISLLSPKPPAPPVLPTGPGAHVVSGDTVLLLGDSIGVGLEQPLAQALAAQGVTLLADVVSGRSITAQAAALGPPSAPPRVVLLSLGSNDTRAQNEEGKLELIRDVYRPAGASVWWIWPPSFLPGQLTPAQQSVADWFAQAQIPMLPTAGPLPSVAGDHDMHLHPDGAGYRSYAQQIAASLTS